MLHLEFLLHTVLSSPTGIFFYLNEVSVCRNQCDKKTKAVNSLYMYNYICMCVYTYICKDIYKCCVCTQISTHLLFSLLIFMKSSDAQSEVHSNSPKVIGIKNVDVEQSM